VDYLLNQQGIYGDEKGGRKLFEQGQQAQNELKFNVRIEYDIFFILTNEIYQI
jgi:hypothetical protein